MADTATPPPGPPPEASPRRLPNRRWLPLAAFGLWVALVAAGADRVTTSELVAQLIRGGRAEITEATIETLVADKVSVTESLLTPSLGSNEAPVASARIQNITADSLTAGSIGNPQAPVANLVAGTVTAQAVNAGASMQTKSLAVAEGMTAKTLQAENLTIAAGGNTITLGAGGITMTGPNGSATITMPGEGPQIEMVHGEDKARVFFTADGPKFQLNEYLHPDVPTGILPVNGFADATGRVQLWASAEPLQQTENALRIGYEVILQNLTDEILEVSFEIWLEDKDGNLIAWPRTAPGDTGTAGETRTSIRLRPQQVLPVSGKLWVYPSQPGQPVTQPYQVKVRYESIIQARR